MNSIIDLPLKAGDIYRSRWRLSRAARLNLEPFDDEIKNERKAGGGREPLRIGAQARRLLAKVRRPIASVASHLGDGIENACRDDASDTAPQCECRHDRQHALSSLTFVACGTRRRRPLAPNLAIKQDPVSPSRSNAVVDM